MNSNRQLLREVHGRSFHTTSGFYDLPADIEEQDRLNIQGEMFKHLFNGPVIPEAAEFVQRVLSSSEEPFILDVGTGSGAWSIEMASLYPNSRVVGIDLTPVNPRRVVPPNCDFLIHDANTGLKPYHGQFDVVHCRCIAHGITDWQAFLTEAMACLKQNGVLLIIGADGMRCFNEDREPILQMSPGEEGFSHFNRLTMAAQAAHDKRRIQPTVHQLHTQEWLKALDGKVVECGRQSYLIPIGAWEDNLSENDRIAAELLRRNAVNITGSFRPALIASEIYPPEEVDAMISCARDEVENTRFKQYVKWYGVWAISA